VFQVSETASLVIIGQAPGARVHQSGVPWMDASGKRLREWLGIGEEVFYDSSRVAIIPMGFCYPGKGKSGDLPPRKECAPLWHEKMFSYLPEAKMTLLIGQYAQKYYLKNERLGNLTETVRSFQKWTPTTYVLPHPSPRNRYWLTKNPWFASELLPQLREDVQRLF
jgi:uracil-DNA glycosylase family 4